LITTMIPYLASQAPRASPKDPLPENCPKSNARYRGMTLASVKGDSCRIERVLLNVD